MRNLTEETQCKHEFNIRFYEARVDVETIVNNITFFIVTRFNFELLRKLHNTFRYQLPRCFIINILTPNFQGCPWTDPREEKWRKLPPPQMTETKNVKFS